MWKTISIQDLQERKSAGFKSKELRVVFLYPNERGMSTIPPAIALLSQIVKDSGHKSYLFDTTYYEFDDDIAISDADEANVKALTFRPTAEAKSNYITKKSGELAGLEFVKLLENTKPDLIAVSVTETTFMRGIGLCRLARLKLGSAMAPTLFGGVFPTFAPDLTIGFPEVDMLCVGEGENCLKQLLHEISTDGDYSGVTNLWWKQGSSLSKNKISAPVDINLQSPITDIGLFGEERFYRPMGGKIRRLLPVETHRGCPYSCTFCNSPAQNRLYDDESTGGFFRKKNIKLIEQEIRSHIKEWGVEYIYFWADTFLAWSSKEFDEFIEMYSDIRLPFWCQTRIETITYDKLSKLKAVGLDRMTFGMEHGNEKFRREVVKRPYSNELAIRLMKIPGELDIKYSVNNIIGFPDETRELAFDTIELNRKFDADSLSCSTFVPFHGTELRSYAVERGYLDKDFIATVSNSGKSVLRMPQWDSDDIDRLRNTFAMYVKFPKDRWPQIKLAETDSTLHAELSAEYIQTYWNNSSAKIEDDLAEAGRGIF